MKHKKWALFLSWPLLLILALTADLRAETQFSGMVKLFSSIYLEDNASGRYFPHGAGEFGLRRLEVRFGLTGNITDKVSYSVRLDGFASPDALSLGANSGFFPESSALGAPERSEPYEVSLFEASVKVHGFLLKNLDLTVGKQRLSWGTADKMNVVDNLNPVDLANFFTFDPDYFAERRPQTGINLEYYFGESTRLQFVWLLERQYSPLPRGFSSLLGQAGAGGGSGEVHLDPQAPLFKNTNYGLRFATMLGKLDLGLTWYHGNFHLPVLKEAAFSAMGGAETRDREDVDENRTEATLAVRGGAKYLLVPERWQIAGALGYYQTFNHGEYSSLFADIYLDYLHRPWTFGVGLGGWALTRGDDIAPTFLAHVDYDLPWTIKSKPVQLTAEVRHFLDALDRVGANHVFLLGLKFNF